MKVLQHLCHKLPTEELLQQDPNGCPHASWLEERQSCPLKHYIIVDELMTLLFRIWACLDAVRWIMMGLYVWHWTLAVII